MAKSRDRKRRATNTIVHGDVHSSATHGGVSVAIGGTNQAPIRIQVIAQPEGSGAASIQWETSFVKGSSFRLRAGYAGTLDSLNGHHRECFSSDATMILGTLDGALMSRIAASRASWRIPVKPHFLRDYVRGFVAIGSLRFYGGLHSRQYRLEGRSLNKRQTLRPYSAANKARGAFRLLLPISKAPVLAQHPALRRMQHIVRVAIDPGKFGGVGLPISGSGNRRVRQLGH